MSFRNIHLFVEICPISENILIMEGKICNNSNYTLCLQLFILAILPYFISARNLDNFQYQKLFIRHCFFILNIIFNIKHSSFIIVPENTVLANSKTCFRRLSPPV